jgi:acid phosphatase family membrane protein YuiD
MNWFSELIHNPFLVIPVLSWLCAQVLKTVIHSVINRKFDITRLCGDGGMPSGHSATVTSLAAVSALVHGFGSFEFAVTAILAIIVCHDAMGVRQETGKQAVLINELVDIVEKLKIEHRLPTIELKEFVGHTPLQVAAGILLGFLDALLMYFVVFA